MFYGTVWDPRLIVSQILTMQCLYYLLLGFLLWIFDALSSNLMSIGRSIIVPSNRFKAQIFSYEFVTFSTFLGRVTILAFVINAFASAFFLLYVVERAKRCLDFTITIHFFHFLGCLVYAGFPKAWTWWIINIICVIITSVFGTTCIFYKFNY